MTIPSARARLAISAALGLVVGVVTGLLWSWDADSTVLLALLTAGVGYYLALWTVIVRTARVLEDERLRNVPVGL
ncbi:hypothetical protein [Petropleomorpha daqingensis]|uniref:Putative membrane protein n=1 Tax=Petropleomorpha daqingensis TaxID=2026353 RepID=A0A853CBK7_9ACTN|nr:hypothetical protein [Petropleomorpha daqingensis]NYJ04002.1 putative membrane protein [Petropleomorpha daqingensis]